MSREMWVSQRRPRLFLPGLKMLRLAAVGSMGVLTPDYRNWGGWGMAAVCNAEREMPVSQSVAEIRSGTGLLVLGVDTCGPSGSVALARLEGASASILGLKELAGRSYSATLVAAVGELLAEHRVKLADVGDDCGGQRAGELYRCARGVECGEGAGGAGADSGGGCVAIGCVGGEGWGDVGGTGCSSA